MIFGGCIKRALFGSALFVVCAFVFAFPTLAETARVAQVLDGDSLRLTDGRELRLIGVNAPEHGKDGRADEPLARAARALLTRLVAGQEIRLDYDAERHDRYRRTLAHAFLADGRSVQEILLREGAAFLIAHPPNLARLDTYVSAQTEARGSARGIWAHSYYQARDAAQLGHADTGFRMISGRVQRVGRVRDSIYLDLTERVTLVIPQKHWHLFGGEANHLLGKRVVARGWITSYQNRLHLQLSHPVMLEVVD